MRTNKYVWRIKKKDGNWVETTRAELAKELGFLPQDMHTRPTPSGTLVFTGKRIEDLDALYNALNTHGYICNPRLEAQYRKAHYGW